MKNRLQIRFAVKRCGEGHIVECASWSSLKWWHSLDTVFSLIWRQLTTQLIRKDVWLQILKIRIKINFQFSKLKLLPCQKPKF